MRLHRSLLLFAPALAGCSLPARPAASPPAAGSWRQTATEVAPRLPRAGDRVLDVRAYYGIPILQKSFFWDGNGEVDQFGLRARHLWYSSDNVAFGVGLSAMNFLVGGADVQGLEADAIGRFTFWRGDDLSVFVETTGGYLQSTDGIPPGGTEWNFTFSFGPGVDIPIGDGVDLMTGVTYHHISNALGRESPRNPSQNEADLWIGLGFRF